MHTLKSISALALLCCLPWVMPAQAEERMGRWVAGTGSLRVVVEFYMEDGQMHGRVDRVINSQGAEVAAPCDGCPGALAGKPMKGLTFISGLKKGARPDEWVDGHVINLEPGLLRGVRGSCEVKFRQGSVQFFGYKWSRALGRKVVWPAFEGEGPPSTS